MLELPPPPCEKGNGETSLQQTIARFQEVPEVHLFRCVQCDATNYRQVVDGTLVSWP